MAAEVLANAGVSVDVYDAMPSAGRKLLMAGRGGLNITHAEPAEELRKRYGARQKEISPLLDAFPPTRLREWVHGLGVATFIGSSGRVFPTDMKAAPLLRAWLQRLRRTGVRFRMRHHWSGWTPAGEGRIGLSFATPQGTQAAASASGRSGPRWRQLGQARFGRQVVRAPRTSGHRVAALRPANCGFDTAWSEHLRERFAGQPIKAVSASLVDADGVMHRRRGEFMLTTNGVEGGLIYALSAALRDTIDAQGSAALHLDLLPEHTAARVLAEVARARGARSLSSHLQSRLRLKGAKVALLRECLASRRCRSGTPGGSDQGPAAAPARHAPARRSNQQRRRRLLSPPSTSN
jgi:uncharacterized flavoprotein (TIGR03862 family)